jgi:hypothetical protein
MIWLYFASSAIVYVAYLWLSYTPRLKDSNLAFWVAMGSALLVAWLWLEVAKRSESPERLFFYSLCWDAVVLIASLAIPITIFGVRPSVTSAVGVMLFVLGVVLVKVGSNQ